MGPVPAPCLLLPPQNTMWQARPSLPCSKVQKVLLQVSYLLRAPGAHAMIGLR